MAGLLDFLNMGGQQGLAPQQGLMAQQGPNLQDIARGLLTASGPSPYKKNFMQVLGEGMTGGEDLAKKRQREQLEQILLQSQIAKAGRPELQSVKAGERLIDPATGKVMYEGAPEQMTPYQRAMLGMAQQRLKMGAPGAKPLPSTALKMQNEELDMIGTASNIDADLGNIITAIDKGKLKVGPLENAVSSARNWAGVSSENSRNFATFKSSLEKLRNDSLRLNKGVQTEGDAQRAWNEILANINDEQLVKQRLEEVRQINRRAVELKKLNVDNLRANYNQQAIDYSGYTGQRGAIMNDSLKGDISSLSDDDLLKALGGM